MGDTMVPIAFLCLTTLLACFRTPAFPAIRPGAAKRNTCQKGTFQGITANTMPSGS